MTIKRYVDLIELARIAYNAYGENRDWTNFKGDPMPKWEVLPEPQQIGWIAVAVAVRNVLLPDNPDRGTDVGT